MEPDKPSKEYYEHTLNEGIVLTREIRDDLLKLVNRELPLSEVDFLSFQNSVFRFKKHPHLIFKGSQRTNRLRYENMILAAKFIDEHQLQSLLLPHALFLEIQNKFGLKIHFIVEEYIDTLPVHYQPELFYLYEDQLRPQIAELIKFILQTHLKEIRPVNLPLKFEKNGEIKFVLMDLGIMLPEKNGIVNDFFGGEGLIFYFSPRLTDFIIHTARQEGLSITEEEENRARLKVERKYEDIERLFAFYHNHLISSPDQPISMDLKNLDMDLNQLFELIVLDTDDEEFNIRVDTPRISNIISKKTISLKEVALFFISNINASIASKSAEALPKEPKLFFSVRIIEFKKENSRFSPYIRLGKGIYREILNALMAKKQIYFWTENPFSISIQA